MRICLIPLKTEPRNPSANVRHFQQRLAELAPYAPELICLPECAFTGYLYELHDLDRYAEPIPGETTAMVAALARTYRCAICFGLLERAAEGFYSSAVLIEPSGQIAVVQRKMSEQPPFVAGDDIHVADTAAGRLAILICGDLFDEDARTRLGKRADVVIVPLARSFDGTSPDLERWLREERQAYADAVRTLGVMALIVNALENPAQPDASFGGAMVISPRGDILGESPHGTDEALIFEIQLFVCCSFSAISAAWRSSQARIFSSASGSH
ncbi:MAG: carbon-nitrogen hydrolase family protein [Roseiflexaceae bacterium]|nr:carbon-nitrogen hydrolase family protein [Roseiflexaceae bacterium]